MGLQSPPPGGLIAFAVIFWILQATLVALRLWSRNKDKLQYGADDYFLLAASISFLVIYTVPVIIGAAGNGLGEHLRFSPTGEPILPNKTFDNIQFIFLNFNMIPVGLARLSIIFLYMRIFVGRRFRLVIWILVVYTAVWTVGFFLGFLLRCIPPSTATYPPQKCIADVEVLTRALGITSVISDVFILVAPWPFLSELQMEFKQKVAVGFIFLLGNLTIAASVVRCVTLWEVANYVENGFPDLPYYDGINVVWGTVESGLGIVCACLPALRRYLWLKVALPSRLRSIGSRVRLLFSTRRTRSDSYDRFGSTRADTVSLERINQAGSENRADSTPDLPKDIKSGRQIGIRHEVEIRNESV